MESSKFPQPFTPKMVKGIKGFSMCSFLIGLEGWRRGLKLKYYGDIHQYSDIITKSRKPFGRSYSFEYKDKIHYFNQSRGDLVSNEAVTIAQSKQKTKKHLERHSIPVLPSIEFTREHTDEEIVMMSQQIGFPLIIKPTYGTLSKGVVLNIDSESELAASLKHVRGKLGYKNVIVERYFEGEDIRLYVVDGIVVAALRRVPAKVTGDGTSTIKQLIDQKNKSRKSNPYLAERLIKMDDEVHSVLNKNDYDLDTVLEAGNTTLVKNKSTMNQGVDLYDITDEIDDNIKELAVITLKSLPNIPHGSIDMLYNGSEAIILEVNPSANISMHMFPTEGKPRNIGAYLMDYYFPETIARANMHENMYFDLLDIVKILKRNYTNYVEVKALPNSPIYANQFIVSGKLQNTGYQNWVKRQAVLQNIHGFVKNRNNGNVEIVVASHDLQRLKDFQHTCSKGTEKAKVNDLKSVDWIKEIKMGFEIIPESKKRKKAEKPSVKKDNNVTFVQKIKKLLK
ncbi:acylphosphatase [Virgibacillus oceani]|uniref:Acylphosphatase n=1 Tax=Virgibacillus oceani TaxID=1479511 RepID=A0A917HBD2_9BACI|nr:acylphosphatase [Virgibacillus oceani]GGG73411.1 hypothetical protein GCM10011398_17330 [Virgibacillus oceani]